MSTSIRDYRKEFNDAINNGIELSDELVGWAVDDMHKALTDGRAKLVSKRPASKLTPQQIASFNELINSDDYNDEDCSCVKAYKKGRLQNA